MKIKFLSAVLFFALLNNAAFSQKISLGVKAGADVHKIDGISFDQEYKFGYHIGGYLEIKLKKIGIQPELYFSQVNAKNGTGNSFLNGPDTKIKLSYLNIPILANIYFNQNVALQLGPQFGILVNEDISGQNNVENAFKKGDFSIAAGLQIKISRFRIYGRYVIGLTDQNNIKNISNQESWKGQTIHFGLGYTIL